MTSELRFGVVNESVLEGPVWLDYVRRVEDAGVDTFLIRDHFSAAAYGQQLAPFSALATAAAVTQQLRVGTLVLSNDFRHPAIVAHEAASLHHLSGGRFELGIGAGWYQPEYDAAGTSGDCLRAHRYTTRVPPTGSTAWISTCCPGAGGARAYWSAPAGRACCGSPPATPT